jgi:RNA polymerase sigma-70 factor (ECF subfamily)
MPDEAEARGLLALMLLQDSRRNARMSTDGELVLLEDQDRSLWDAAKIEEGLRVLDRAVALRRPGTYQLQAAIAALHAQARVPEETDWEQIATLYGALEELTGSAVVSLNKAVAVAMARGPGAGLHEVDGLSGLEAYHLFHATRADLLRRLERAEEAAAAYRRALELVTSPVERRYLERRLRSLA